MRALGKEKMSQEIADQLKKEFENITDISCEVTFMEKGNHHRPTTLRDGKKGVYAFLLNDNVCFKVGKANSNSKARWNSHHYSLDKSTPSTLTKSMLTNLHIMRKYFDGNDINKFEVILKKYDLESTEFKSDIKKLEKDKVKSLSAELGLKKWIMNNMSRIEFLLNDSDDDFDSNLLEAIVQFKLKPIFEGKNA
ncbi:MAG: hypothetical protein ACJAS1_007472 [Oleiphilaceae bacterium]|jgi:hypothetical protein